MREEWARQPLALELFKEANAGEEFFRRMEVLRRDSRPDPDTLGALEVYVVCVSMGFRGRCADAASQEELRETLHLGSRAVTEGRDGNRLSPAWQVDESVAQRVGRLSPWRFVIVGLGVATIIWCGFQLWIQLAANGLAMDLSLHRGD
jgi:type IV/VI secretion system ImpK/VasF family protein